MRTLLIHNAGDAIAVYAFDATDEQEELLRRVHGKCVNSTENSPEDEDIDAMEGLLTALEGDASNPAVYSTEREDNPVQAFDGRVVIVYEEML